MKMKRILLSILIVALLISTSLASVSAKVGTAASPEFMGLEKAVFIHYEAPAKPPWAGGPKSSEEGYKLFRGGVKWADGDTPVSYSINIDSIPEGLDDSEVVDAITAAFEEWDSVTAGELFSTPTTASNATGFDPTANDIFWADLDQGVIAVTYFWWYTGTKDLAAFDMVFNTDYLWGINGVEPADANTTLGNTSFMDVRNIATHEAGHTLVLGDLYQSQYSEMTMYGYSTFGEVKAISLELGDIAGAQVLYGAP